MRHARLPAPRVPLADPRPTASPRRMALGPSTLALVALAGCSGKDDTPENQPPTCTITSPADGAVFLSGTEVPLTADVVDPEGDTLSIYWTSTASGAIADGPDTSAVLPDGAQVVTVQALDDHGNPCDASVSVVVDLPPTLSILYPADGQALPESTSVGLSATLSDPDDSASELTLSWSDSVAGDLGSANASADGTATVIASLSTPGPHTLTATVTDPAGATASTTVDVVVDTPPGTPTVSLSPEAPATGDDLVASIATESVDADGDPVTYAWNWYADGVLSTASTSETLPASATSKGQVWTVRAVPNDGVMDGVAGEAYVTIGNTVPSMVSLTLSPDPLHTNENCVGTPVADDPDGDAVSYEWTWTVNGRQVIDSDETFNSFNFKRGDVVKAKVVPSDADGEGESLTASLTVVNTAPDNLELAATPSPLEGIDDIVCEETNVRDYDGDDVALTITWTVDGVAWTDVTTTTYAGDTVPAADVLAGEVWTCTAIPNDGYEDGASASSSTTARACAGGDVSCPVADCQTALDEGGSAGDGAYWLDLDGTVSEAWCDMTTDGGGWTLVLQSSDDGVDTFTWDDRTATEALGTVGGSGDYRDAAFGALGFTELLAIHAPSDTWGVWAPGDGSSLDALLGDQPTDPATTWPMTAGTLAVSGTLCNTDLGLNVADSTGVGDSYGPTWSVDGGSGCGGLPGAYGGVGPDGSAPTVESDARGFGAALGLNTGAAGTGENRIEVYVR